MSKPTGFDAFGTMRAVRGDDNLTAPQKALLWAAALRTNNSDGKVRASLEMLAADAKLSRRTAERAFAVDQAEALKYFARVERSKRRVDLSFKMQPSTTESRTRESDTESQSPGLTGPSTTQSRTRESGRGMKAEPSTTFCPPSATQSRTECDTESHHLPTSTSTSSKSMPTLGQAADPWSEAEANREPATARAAAQTGQGSVDWSKMPSFDDEATPEPPATEPAYIDSGEALSFAAKEARRRARLAERNEQPAVQRVSRYAS